MTKRDTAKGRFYTVDGIDLPSVTSILSCVAKPALIAWASKVERELVIANAADLYETHKDLTRPNFILRLEKLLGTEKAHTKELAKAGEIGSQIHRLVEWSLRAELLQDVGPSPQLGDQAAWAYAAFQKWRQSVKLKPLQVEFTVHSKKHGYAGTLDLLAEVDGQVTVCDWKSGKAVYMEHRWQLSAYRQALIEMGVADNPRGLILRLPKQLTDPTFEAVAIEDHEENFEHFLAAKHIWKAMREHEKEVDKLYAKV